MIFSSKKKNVFQKNIGSKKKIVSKKNLGQKNFKSKIFWVKKNLGKLFLG